MRFSTFLTKASRASRDVEAITSNDPKRVERRVRNRVKGRLLGRVGFWRSLWR